MSVPFYVSPADPPGKRRLLECGMALFARDGIDSTSVRDLAAATGYSNPVLFKHFEGKEELALRLFESASLHLAERLEGAALPTRPFVENLRAFLQAYAALLDEALDAFLLVQENQRRRWPRPAPRDPLVARLRSLLVQGREEGAVAGGVPLPLLVASVAGTLGRVARMRYHGEETRPAESLLPELERLLLRLVGATAP